MIFTSRARNGSSLRTARGKTSMISSTIMKSRTKYNLRLIAFALAVWCGTNVLSGRWQTRWKVEFLDANTSKPMDESESIGEELADMEVHLWMMEMYGWINSILKHFVSVDKDTLPDDTVEVWRSLSPVQKEMAFAHCLAVLSEVIQPQQ